MSSSSFELVIFIVVIGIEFQMLDVLYQHVRLVADVSWARKIHQKLLWTLRIVGADLFFCIMQYNQPMRKNDSYYLFETRAFLSLGLRNYDR